MQEKMLFQHTSPRLLKAATPAEPHHPLVEPSLFYDPPYERPLEDEFAWHLVKYLEPISGLQYQVRIETPCANVWVDFVVEHGARRIGFEIGGAEDRTEYDALPDELAYRDALVLGSGALDVLYRFRGGDLMHRLHDALLVTAAWDRTLFSQRGRINLNTLASPEARACRPRPQDTVARITYETQEMTDEIDGDTFAYPGLDLPTELIVRRLSRANPGAWLRTYDDALTHYGVTDDALGRQWAKSA